MYIFYNTFKIILYIFRKIYPREWTENLKLFRFFLY